MDPATASAVANGVQVTAGNLMGLLTYNDQKNFAREQATTAYNRSLEQWNRENQYNSPTAQMERYKQAGLNPNLIYGNGSSSAGNSAAFTASQGSTPSAPQFKPTNIDPLALMSNYADLRIKNEQADLIKAQKDNVIQRTANDSISNILLGLDKGYYTTRNALQDLNLSNLEKYSGDFLSERNRGQTLENSLKAQSLLQNDKKLQLLLDQFNLEKSKFSWQKSFQTKDLDLRAKNLEQQLNMFNQGMSQRQYEFGTKNWIDSYLNQPDGDSPGSNNYRKFLRGLKLAQSIIIGGLFK